MLLFNSLVFAAAVVPPKQGVVKGSQNRDPVPAAPDVPAALPVNPAYSTAPHPANTASANISQRPLQYPAPATLSSPQSSVDFNLPVITPVEPNPVHDLQRIVNNLKSSSRIWPEITNRSLKEMAVYYFISEYSDRGEKIRKPAGSYVDLIDGMAVQSPEMLDQPFDQILRVVAIIEYDLDNGQDKDLMAKQILGEEGAARNRIRLGIQ